MKTIVPKEHDEQVGVCDWLDAKRIPYFAIPNGELRHIRVATRLKAEGVKRGVPDLFITRKAANGRFTFLEMKRVKNWDLSDAQKAWHQILDSEGFNVIIGYGAMDAIDKLEDLGY